MTNPALTSYVLVNEDNQPVPLPFHTKMDKMPIIIYNFDQPRHANSSGRVHTSNGCFFPHIFNLKIITENEYMARQAGREPFHLLDANGSEINLPHTVALGDDGCITITSVDGESLVEETTRSISWFDPAPYGLRIVADCDLQVTA